MPLEKGSSREAVSHNIDKLVEEGRKRREAIAIALDEAGLSNKDKKKPKKKKRGG